MPIQVKEWTGCPKPDSHVSELQLEFSTAEEKNAAIEKLRAGLQTVQEYLQKLSEEFKGWEITDTSDVATEDWFSLSVTIPRWYDVVCARLAEPQDVDVIDVLHRTEGEIEDDRENTQRKF